MPGWHQHTLRGEEKTLLDICHTVHVFKDFGCGNIVLLCALVLVPQITDGAVVPPVTEKVSVRQLVARDNAVPVAPMPPTPPRLTLANVMVRVLGPLMTKVVKSRRS